MVKVIDISHHQNIFPFNQLVDDVRGVIIRAGYSNTVDTQAKRNVEECKRRSIPYGLYWYSYAVTEDECEKEVQAFMQFVVETGSEGVCLFLDMEDADGKKANKAVSIGKKWNDDLIYEMTVTFLIKLSNNYSHIGRIGLYASQSYYEMLDKRKNQSICDDINIVRWVARWNTQAPTVLCDIWQFTNSFKWSLTVDGNCDCSYLTKTMWNTLFSVKKKDVSEEVGEKKNLSDYTVQQMLDEIMKR